MSLLQSNSKVATSTGFYDFPIEQSLRFDGSSYLSRTPSSAGNRKTWTWSGWVKRSSLSAHNPVIFSADTGNAPWTAFQFTQSDGTIQITTFAGTSSGLYNNASFRDLSAWYHIVVAMDTTQATAANRVKLYVNGVEQTFSNTNYPAQNSDTKVNGTLNHYIGFTNNQYFNGYMAEINFIDGTALNSTSFGETKNGVWIPKDPSGLTYGTNGFRLTFSNASDLGEDSSGNDNDWTVN
jgi:hypothetical protein